MARVNHSTAEILAHHTYAKPHVEAGCRLHGGFDAAERPRACLPVRCAGAETGGVRDGEWWVENG